MTGHIPTISRRAVLLGSAGAVLLVACGNDKKSTRADDTGGAPSDVQLIYAGPPERFFATGTPQRAPLILTQGEALLDDPPETIGATLISLGDGSSAPEPIGKAIELTRHDEGIPRPYYPLRFTPEAPGLFAIRTEYQDTQLDSNAFQVSVREEVALPQVGGPMIPVETPTPDDARGVDPICTLDPPCGLHDITLTDALAMGKPVAFLVSTPAYCQTQICGPVLDLLVQESEGRDLIALHAEVWKDAARFDGDIAQATPTEALDAYGMTDAGYEPAIFIAGSDGNLVDRLDLVWDASELRAGLDQVS